MLALNCKEVTRLLAMSHVEDLSASRRLQVRFHLMICYVCRTYERQMRHLAVAFREWMGQATYATPVDQLKARWVGRLVRR